MVGVKAQALIAFVLGFFITTWWVQPGPEEVANGYYFIDAGANNGNRYANVVKFCFIVNCNHKYHPCT